MRFDPISDRRNFTTVADAARFDQQAEERNASANDGFVSELQAEMDKLAWCDTLILQFPIWWLGMPAILKGWIDRTFASGRSYGGGRMFDRGVHRGKRAMQSVTVGGPVEAYSDDGIYPPIEAILLPITRGTLGFVGFDVVEPFVVYGPARMTADERAGEIEKIKTIGDAYMVAAGLPEFRSDHCEAIMLCAIEMLDVIDKHTAWNGEPIKLRIGINTGPVVAGVIGTKKFIYDLWGDTVNVASRMESNGLTNSIHVTESVRQTLGNYYKFEAREPIFVKGKGQMSTYVLVNN